MKEHIEATQAFEVHKVDHHTYEVRHKATGDVYRKCVQLTTANQVRDDMNVGWLRGRQDRTHELADVAAQFDALCESLKSSAARQEVA